MSSIQSLGITLSVLAVDQFSKYYILRAVHREGNFFQLGQAVKFHVVYNPGGAFGLFPNKQLVFILVGVVVTGLLLYLLFSMQLQPIACLGLALALGGSLGNLIDRLLHGAVIDFIQIYSFPVFNIADMAIVSGAVIVIATFFTEGVRT